MLFRDDACRALTLTLTTRKATRMALSKPSKSPAPAAGKFEDTDAPAATATAPAPKAAPKDEAAATAGVTASTEVARIAAGSLAHQQQSEAVLTKLKDQIPAVQFGTFPRLVGSNGNVMDKDGKILGTWVDVTLLSWNETFVISPGSDNDEAKDFVRYSRDGVTIDDSGEDVNAYLKKLREVDGYTKAAKKRYVELIGFLEAAEKDKTHVGKMVQISLSPQSIASWESYRWNTSIAIRLGRKDVTPTPDRVRVTPVIKTKGKDAYTLLNVDAAPQPA